MEAALQVGGTSIYVRRAITALALGGSEGVGQLAGVESAPSWSVCAALLAFLGNSTHAGHSTRPPEIYSSSLSASQKILA